MPDSEVARVNELAGIGSVAVSSDTYDALLGARTFSACCPGLFDLTIGPLVDLWRKSRATGEPPAPSIVRQLLPLVDHAGVWLDPRTRTAQLRSTGQSVDLGGIGKGFAGDKFREIFRSVGVSSALSDIGGNVVTLGARPDGSAWRVGIRHPRRDGSLIGLVAVDDKAVVTSGDYQRYFADSLGRMHHHILDPTTGFPAMAGLISVTIVDNSSLTADALSTAVFAAGMSRGKELLRAFSGSEAVLVDTGGCVYITPGLKDCFQPADGIDPAIL
jgi:thiamine biosynthesis lipoprotein